jgi:hypothetical protein
MVCPVSFACLPVIVGIASFLSCFFVRVNRSTYHASIVYDSPALAKFHGITATPLMPLLVSLE